MDRERFQRISDLFEAAIERSPEERAAYLDEACGDDVALRREVEALLAEDEHQSAATAAETVVLDDDGTATGDGVDAGVEIGPYRLLHRIGEGGMGEVYLARQDRPLRRHVAVKIIKRGMDSEHVVARFETERQALALMDHPCIARVFDAGQMEDGRPFFVMEYVRGESITRYADRQRLDMSERLEIFMQVCEGVQHAHQKAVIHRDLKPSNVLVTVQGDKAVPKIIDFGVAKATVATLTEHTMFTEHGQLVGTPSYMSPEQASSSVGVDVDTRSDIYSLGVLLYELLVGMLPFDPSDLRRAGYEEILRKIREDEPPRPSTRLSSVDDTTTNAAKMRGTSAPRLSSQLRGDLDWITMKALEKDRTRRYASPSELAADIHRYLRDEPVLAGPPSAAYRVRKFARRHRAGVAFSAVVATMLVAFGVVMSVQAQRIARERDRANDEALTSTQVADFLTELFRASDPSEAKGDDLTARILLDRGAERIEALDEQPAIQASLRETIGYVYVVQGYYDQADPLLNAAVTFRETEGDPAKLASSLHRLANLHDTRGAEDDAEPIARRAVDLWVEVGDEERRAESLNTLGNVLWHQGRLDEAEPVFRESLAIRERELGASHRSIAQSLHNLAAMRYFANDFAQAEEYWTRAARIQEAERGADDWGLATTNHTLAILYSDQGRYDEALPLELRSLEVRERVLGPEHPYVALSLTTLGNIYRETGRADEAVPLIERAVTIATAAWSEGHGEVWWMRRSLARVQLAADALDAAEAEITALIALIEQSIDEETAEEDDLPANLDVLGAIQREQDRLDAAQATFERSLAIGLSGEDAEDDPYVALTRAGLANVHRDAGRYDEAETLYERALAVLDEAFGADDPDRKEVVADFEAMRRLRDGS